eukprot:jgi/Hompol1/6850/HPOL_003306-RA
MTSRSTSGDDLVLFIPTEHTVKTGDTITIKYAGAMALTLCTEAKTVHTTNSIKLLKWSPSGQFLASADDHGNVGLWSQQKYVGHLSLDEKHRIEGRIVEMAWCEITPQVHISRGNTTSADSLDESVDEPTIKKENYDEQSLKFEHSTVGARVMFGSRSLLVLMESFEAHLFFTNASGKPASSKIVFSRLDVSGKAVAAQVLPLQDSLLRIVYQVGSASSIPIVELGINDFTGDLNYTTSTIVLDPTEVVSRIHQIDGSRIAVVSRLSNQLDVEEYFVSLWHSEESDDFMENFRMSVKRRFSGVAITSISHLGMLSTSNNAHVLMVGMRNGDVIRLDSSTLETLDSAQCVLFDDILLNPVKVVPKKPSTASGLNDDATLGVDEKQGSLKTDNVDDTRDFFDTTDEFAS